MKRKLFALILTLTMIFSAFSMFTFAEESASTPTATPGTTVVAKLDGTDMTLEALQTAMSTNGFDGYVGKTLTLTADIVVAEFAPKAVFKGTLDGAGHTISGLTSPLFSLLQGATVKSLTLEGDLTRNITSTTYLGLIAASAQGGSVMESITTKGSIKVEGSGMTFIGGLVGTVATVTARKCVNYVNLENHTTQTYGYCGGIFGRACGVNGESGDLTLEQCMNYGNMISDKQPGAHSKCGGMVGTCENGGKITTMTNCINYGTLTAKSQLGGMTADLRSTGIFTSCYNFGNMVGIANDKAVKPMIGGLVGQIYNNPYTSFVNCVNTGDVTAPNPAEDAFSHVGGFVGMVCRTIELRGCVNTGTITGKSNVGGLIGTCRLNAATTRDNGLFNSINLGRVYSLQATRPVEKVGGLIGAYGNKPKDVVLQIVGSYSIVTAEEKAIGYTDEPSYQFPSSNFKAVLTYDGVEETVEQGETAGKSYFETLVGKLHPLTVITADQATKKMPVLTLGVQQTKVADGKFDLRFVAGVDSLKYSKVGFELVRIEAGKGNSALVKQVDNVVYTSLNGYNENGEKQVYTAADLGVAYLAATTVTNIPATGTVTFLVRPYAVSPNGEVIYSGMPMILTYVNGVLQTSN